MCSSPFLCLRLDKELLDLTLKVQSIKRKADELGFIKMKNFGSAKDPVKRMKKKSYRLGEYVCKLYI